MGLQQYSKYWYRLSDKYTIMVNITCYLGTYINYFISCRIAELHPALAEAAALIAAAVHEEAVGGQNQASLPPLSSGYSYSLDALSEDDEMDSSQVHLFRSMFSNMAII